MKNRRIKIKNTIIAKVLGFTPPAVSSWRKQNRPIIELLETYFTANEIEDFLENGRISDKDDQFSNNQFSKIEEIFSKNPLELESKALMENFLSFLFKYFNSEYNFQVLENPFFTLFAIFLSENEKVASQKAIIQINKILSDFEKNNLWSFFVDKKEDNQFFNISNYLA